ncbi:MAG: CHASE2 domain-containing protein, partial [Nostoc sp.]
PGFDPLREKYLQQLQPDEEVQVLIRTNNETLQKLPWQLWELIEKYPEAGVALSPAEYERPADNNRPLGRNQVKNKIKILAILGHSKGIKVDE